MADEDLDRLKSPDIEFEAVVKAKELRFEEVPDTDVSFRGEPGHDSTSGTERRNLPDEVEPGVTYRRPWVRLRIASRLLSRPPEEKK